MHRYSWTYIDSAELTVGRLFYSLYFSSGVHVSPNLLETESSGWSGGNPIVPLSIVLKSFWHKLFVLRRIVSCWPWFWYILIQILSLTQIQFRSLIHVASLELLSPRSEVVIWSVVLLSPRSINVWAIVSILVYILNDSIVSRKTGHWLTYLPFMI